MPDRGSTYNHFPLPVTSEGLTLLFTVASPLPLQRRGDSVIAEEKAINTYYPLFCPYHLWKKATARARSVSSLPLGEGGGRGSHHLQCKVTKSRTPSVLNLICYKRKNKGNFIFLYDNDNVDVDLGSAVFSHPDSCLRHRHLTLRKSQVYIVLL